MSEHKPDPRLFVTLGSLLIITQISIFFINQYPGTSLFILGSILIIFCLIVSFVMLIASIIP